MNTPMTPSIREALKPCPFCGGPATLGGLPSGVGLVTAAGRGGCK